MKKIGILSMQRIKNYGSYLQAYALKSVIESFGVCVEFVDYHVEAPLVIEDKKNNNIHKIICAIKGDAPFIQKIKYIYYKYVFNKKYLPDLGISKKMNYNPKLDVLVIGSDEVFNCVQKNRNVGYSLELFGKDSEANKVITYAASFGNTTINKLSKYNKTDEIAELLSNINSISVRDENSSKIVENLIGRKPKEHLDPVLIYDFYKQKELIPVLKLKERYMIVYAYNQRITKTESEWIRDFSKTQGLKVYAIGGAQSCADKFIVCSPFEVLSYFENCEFIITDTFHGSIFSIITQKPFVTMVRSSINDEYGNEEKLFDLLNRLDLSKRIAYKIEDAKNILSKEIDYDKVMDIVSFERTQAISYLEDNVK